MAHFPRGSSLLYLLNSILKMYIHYSVDMKFPEIKTRKPQTSNKVLSMGWF